MTISTVTSKGQVTVPKKVRDALHLRTGDKIDFRIEEDGSVRLYPIARKVSDVFGAFEEKAARPYTAVETKKRIGKAFREGKL